MAPRSARKEISSGARPIQAVGTSVAAFVGTAPRGRVDRPQRIVSFQEFVRHFGGIDGRSLLGYSIQHFFANGGHEAYVVRLAADNALAASVILSRALKVEARSPGVWAEEYSVEIRAYIGDPSRFRLTVWHTPSSQPPVVGESFADLSILSEDPRSVTSVLATESSYVKAAVVGSRTSPPANTPAGASAPLVGGDDGDVLVPNTAAFEGKLNPANGRSGLSLLDRIDFDLLCVPGETNPTVVARLQKYCRDKRAFAIIDSIEDKPLATLQSGPDPALTGADALNSALYFPWVKASDPLQGRIRDFPPCGFIAGIYARTDRARGVWKAPAGSEAGLIGATGVTPPLTEGESQILNSRGINCIRALPGYGTVAWGSRTLHGDDRLASDWKYVPVRRFALYIENSLFRGTRWAVFEPNDEPLWAKIRLNVGAFMHDLFTQGAFPGAVSRDAYFVKCGKDTTTQHDIDRGTVNIVVGFAPLKPAEFIVINIQQSACRPVEATAAQRGVRTRRQDPYKNFKFRVKWEGRYVAGVSKVARLHRATGVPKHREGAAESSSSRSPGRTVYEAVTLEHGITYDSEFAKWARTDWNSEVDSQGPPGDFRKDILIDVYDEAGRLALSCKVFHCWVSEFQALPDLDANANAVGIQHLKLEEEGWECDCHVTEPSEPTSTDTSG